MSTPQRAPNPEAQGGGASSCKKISLEEYQRQSKEYTRKQVAMLSRSEDFKQFKDHKDQEELFQLVWIIGPALLMLIMYVDFMVCFTESNNARSSVQMDKLFGAALNSIPSGAGKLIAAFFIITIVCPMAFMAPWVGFLTTYLSAPQLWETVLAHGITAAILASCGLKIVHRPPYVVTQPELELRSMGGDAIKEFLIRFVPLFAPMLVGAFFFRWKNVMWKRASIIPLPLLTMPIMIGSLTLVLWRVLGTAAKAGMHQQDTWEALQATVAQDFRLLQTWHGTDLIIGAAVPAFCIYSWVLLFSTFLFAPLVVWTLKTFRNRLPTNPQAWVTVMLCLGGGAAYLWINHMLSMSIAMVIGSVMTILLLNGFEA